MHFCRTIDNFREN